MKRGLLGCRGRTAVAAPLTVLALTACGSPPALVGGAGAPVDARAADPTQLVIPSLSLSAPIAPLDVGPDGRLQTPRDFGATGWRRGGPEPGERGAALVTGHVDSHEGPAVFFRLGELERGDRILVRRADGTSVAFWVERLEEHSKERFPTDLVYRDTPGAALRLVTCSGDFDAGSGHYESNTVVFASREPAPGRASAEELEAVGERPAAVP